MLSPKASAVLHPLILRAADIRGVVGNTVTPQTAEIIGKAFGTYLRRNGKTNVCVGFDGRESSPALAEALVNGLLSCGMLVLKVGCCPTPLLYFALQASGIANGVMVTGSHNPKEYNGFKLVTGNAPFFGEQIQELGRIARTGRFEKSVGCLEEEDFSELYIHRLLKDFRHGMDLRVVWDCGNGATGKIVSDILPSLPGRHILINEDIDGSFPCHHPDPSRPANMKQLQDVVLLENADLGLAFDGDGDRLGAVDATGRILEGDQLLQIFAEDLLRLNPAATVIADVKAGKTFCDEIRRMGGNPLIWKTGHSFIKQKMKETKARLGGEMSGHFFFADKYYGYDDALYAGLRLLEIASNSYAETLAQRVNRIPPSFRTPEIEMACGDDKKFRRIETIRKKLAAAKIAFDDTDGIKVVKEDGWWLLRASNTQPMLVARCEGDTPESLNKIKKEMDSYLSLIK